MMTDYISAAAADLARAEDALNTAQVVEGGVRSEVSDVEAKLADIRARKMKIRADLDAGTLTDAQAGGLYQIASADESDLAEILRTATDQLAAAVAVTREAMAARDRAQRDLQHAEYRCAFDALTQRAATIEATLVGAVGELVALAGVLGLPRHLSSAWRPSAALRAAIMFGTPPQRVAE
jgi:hypothetical protein